MFANMTEGEVSEVNVVIKADVQGSVEAICDALVKLSTEEVKVKIVGSGVGVASPRPTPPRLPRPAPSWWASTSVPTPLPARSSRPSLDLRYYSVIYDLLDEVRSRP